MSRNPYANVEFSWKQFWESLIYENLPPVIFSPLAALLISAPHQKRGMYAKTAIYLW